MYVCVCVCVCVCARVYVYMYVQPEISVVYQSRTQIPQRWVTL